MLVAVLLTIMPPLIAAGSLQATVATGHWLDGELALYILPGALLILFVDARLGARYLAAPLPVARLMDASCAVILLIWVWQRAAYLRWVPNRDLEYGYFLTAAGQRAGALVLHWPEAIGLSVLAAGAIAGVFLCARRARIFILPALGWWMGATALFWLPCFYLSAQGEATVFI